MDKKNLESCLNKVFFNDWSPDPTTFLSKLLSLVSYYSDDDFGSELQEAFNVLNATLVSIELVKKVGHTDSYSIPDRFICALEPCGRDNIIPNNFTFSPVINLPELKDISFPKSQIDEISEAISNINVSGLIMYVKRRAVAAGDFILE